MQVTLEIATENDAVALAALRLSAARELAAKFGRGIWSASSDTVEGLRLEVRMSETYLVRYDGAVIATLRLSPRNPWLGGIEFFTARARPIYVTSMVVSPKWQRRGIGRRCMEDAMRIAGAQQADAIRLDSLDLPAGAGEFYSKCSFNVVRRALYFGTPLVWFERLL